MIIETERLYLRQMNQDDFNDLCEILQDKSVMHAYEHAFSDAEVQEWLDKQLKRYNEEGFGLWSVIKKSTGEFIGQAGLTLQEIYGKKVLEIGYLLKNKYWHNGFATEAAIGCKAYAFNNLNASEVYSIIRDNNIASKNVAIRIGMTVFGKVTKHYYNIDMPHTIFKVKRTMQNSIKGTEKFKQLTANPKSIMTYCSINPEDSYFVNGLPPIEAVEIEDYNNLWPKTYEEVANAIKNELGPVIQYIDHIGSTAVPGLSAKPWIDIDLTILDPTDETSYIPALEKLGFTLIVREPKFFEHRLFHLDKPKVNLHVFAPNSPETIRHLLFRDWLRQSPFDCQLYANAKLEAIKGSSLDIAKYNKNKHKVVRDIYTKIFTSLGLIDNE